MVKHLSTMQETWVWSLGQEDPLEKEMAIHSSTIAWKIPWTEESDRASLVAQTVKHLPAMRDIRVRSLGWEDPLEKEMATHSSIFAWEIPLMERPGRLHSQNRKESDTTERLHLRRRTWEPLIHSPLFRSTGDNLDLWMTSEGGEVVL